MIPDFATLVNTNEQKYGLSACTDLTILCFDPGHTTGYAVFKGIELVEAGQLDTDNMETAPAIIRDVFFRVKPSVVVCEDYRVYKWRQEHHVGSEMLTTRVIGCIETLCAFDFIPVIKNMAVIAKRFVTDDKLRAWSMYRPNQRHARDAIRHGCYYLIFRHAHQPKKTNNPHKLTVG